MKLTGKTRQQLLLQNIIYYALLLLIAGLAAWLSVRYSGEADWSANNRNSLSETSQKVIKLFKEPIQLTTFTADDEMTRRTVRELVERFQRHNPVINLTFVNPQTNPAKTREMGITRMGETIIEFNGKQEHLYELTEQSFVNALQRLTRDRERWIVFVSGHGERNPYGQDQNNYSNYGERLQQKGYHVQTLNLAAEKHIPDNTSVLVIASPRSKYLPGEVEMVQKYIENGGNLLWLTEPETSGGLEELDKQLGIERIPGIIIDTAGQLAGIDQPAFLLIVNYNNYDVLPHFADYTVFPQALGLKSSDSPLELISSSLLRTLERSWNETEPLEKAKNRIELNPDKGEQPGPFDIAFNFQRSLPKKAGEDAEKATQRIIVVGDGDFLSNAFIGHLGNGVLGENLINWVSHDDDLISIDRIGAPDTQLTMSEMQVIIIAALFLLVVPLGLIGAGVFIWLKRRKN